MTHADALNSLPVLVAGLDQNLKVRFVNASFARRLNASPDSLVGRSVEGLDLVSSRFGDWVTQARAGLTAPSAFEYAYQPAGPGERSVRFHFAPHPDGVIVAVMEPPPVAAPIADLFSQFMTHVPFIAWLRDDHGRYVYANLKYRAFATAGADWTGKHLSEVWSPDLAEQFASVDQSVLRNATSIETLEAAPLADGTVRTWHNVKFALTEADGRRYVAGIAVDLTDRLHLEDQRRRIERQLLYEQKVDSLGVMAGGVAHDFNNLLTTILGNSSLARMHASDPSPASDCLKKLESAAMRAAELCQQMLAYSGRGQFVVKDVDLNALVRDTQGVLGSVISPGAVITVQLGDSLPVVRGDAGQIRQALVNLIANASDSLADASGTITVRTDVRDVEGDFLSDQHTVANRLMPGRYACLSVTDTGGGMNETTQRRIFEPFFTTKFTGRGLGLSAVQGIVRGHNGAVTVSSRVGSGSTFTLLLPAHAPTPTRSGRGRTVLVIDGEDDVRQVIRRLLETAGFSVLLASDGSDGAATFRNFIDQTAAVVLDQSLPRIGGADPVQELRRIRGDVKMVLTGKTGFAEPPPERPAGPTTTVLRKPFSGDDLLNAVFEAVGP